MPLIIATNVDALTAQRNLTRSQSDLSVALQRLSSGFRINSAKDDAAGLAISERLTTQIRGLNQAARNANDGISLAQTAEGALGETTSLLQRMRELAVQSANDTNSAADRAALQNEVNQLRNELDRIASETSFNGVNLLDGSFTNKLFQIGANTNESVAVSFSATSSTLIGNNSVLTNNANGAGTIVEATNTQVNNFASQTLTISGQYGTADTPALAANSTARDIAAAVNNLTATTGVSASARTTATLTENGNTTAGTVTFDLYGLNTTTAVSVSATIALGDFSTLADAINNFSARTGITAEAVNGSITLTSAEGYDIRVENLEGGTELDFAGDDTTGGTVAATIQTFTAGNNDTLTVGGSVSFSSSSAFSVLSDDANDTLIDTTGGTVAAASTLDAVSDVDLGTQTGANAAIAILDGALDTINSQRSNLGSIQIRFEAAIRNLTTTSENLSAANSRIKDADYALETSRLSRAQILQQAGIQILAAAKDLPQAALVLLQ